MFDSRWNYGNTNFPVVNAVRNSSIWEIPFGKSGFLAKHIENGESDVTDQKGNLIGIFLLFDCFAGYMWITKSYNGNVLTVKGLYALKCIGTHLYHPIVPDTNDWEKQKFPIPNSQFL